MEKVQQENVFNCFQCDNIFGSSQNVAAHVDQEHSSFQCDQCDKIITNKSALKEHMKEHTNNGEIMQKAQYFDELSKMCQSIEAELGNEEDTDSDLTENIANILNSIKKESFPSDDTYSKSLNDILDETQEKSLLGDDADVSNKIKEENVFEDDSFTDDNAYIKEETLGDSKTELDNKFLVEQYKWNHEDPTVPLGWMTSWDKIMNIKLFLSPNGNCFSGRIEAIFYMLSQGTEKGQIEEMRAGLLDDGWTSDDYLPEGWFAKKHTSRNNFFYFTEDNLFLNSISEASVFMDHSDKFGKLEIDNLWKKHSFEKNRHAIKKAKEWIIDEKMVPEGWKRKCKLVSYNSQKRLYFVTPKGASINGVISALQHMWKNNYSEADITIVKQNLAEDGWKYDDCLPEGWHMKPIFRKGYGGHEQIYHFLSNDFKMFRSFKMTCQFLEKIGQSGLKSAKNISLKLEELRKSFRISQSNNGDWNNEKYDLPEGWKLKVTKRSDNKINKYFLAPNGRSVTGVLSTLQYMSKENYPVEDIELISEQLGEDGWKSDELLPKGWYIKEKHYNANGTVKFLTEIFQVVESSTTALDILKNNKKSTTKDVQNLIMFLQKDSSKVNEEKLILSDEDETVPDGWKILPCPTYMQKNFVKSPNGIKFDTIRKALKYMVGNNFDENVIEGMAKHLNKEGWKQDEKLPAGWHYKIVKSYSNQLPIFHFLTIDFEMLSSIKVALQHLTNSSLYDQETIDNFLEKIEDERKFVRQTIYETKDEKYYLPKDWKLKVTNHKDGRVQRFFLSPDGTKCNGVINALKYAVKNNNTSQDIGILSTYLMKDGWKSDELLPKGWYMKKENSKTGIRFIYLSDSFQRIPTGTAALDALKCNEKSTAEDIQNFIKLVNQKSLKGSEERWSWSEGDDIVPHGWKIRTSPTNSKKLFVTSPDGKQFVTVRQSLQFMVENSYSEPDVQLMAKHLIKEGWETQEFLPKGWYTKQKNDKKSLKFNYLSDKFEFLESNTSALDILKNNGKTSPEEIQNFIKLVNQNSLKGSEDRWSWSEGNETIPVGWKLRSCPTNVKKHSVISPDGIKFESIRNALKYMAEKNLNKEDIEIMAKHLIKELWEMHPLLPKGWYMKAENYDKSRVTYLSDKFEFLKSNTSALDILKNNGKSSTEEIQNFIKLANQKSLKGSEDRWTWSEGNEAIPVGWKLRFCPTNKKKHSVISPDGIKFESIRNALKHMAENNCNKQDIDIMAKHLLKECWEVHPLLPKGWYMKPKNDKKSLKFNYLSDKFEFLESNTSAFDILKNNGKSSPDEIQNFMTLVNKHSLKGSEDRWTWSEGNEAIPFGWKLRSCPTNVKKHSVISPDGIKFESIRNALRHMVDNNYIRTDIEMLANHLKKEGWKQDANLPFGWHCKMLMTNVYYLTDTFVELKSAKNVLIFFKNSNKYDQDTINKFKKKIVEGQNDFRKSTYTWSESDGTFPKTWKKRIIDCTNGITRSYFLLPDGSGLRGRVNSLHYMVQNGYSQEEIDVMRDSLLQEGWNQNKMFPKNWLVHDNKVISPSGLYFISSKAAFEYAENPKFKEDIIRFSDQSKKRTAEENPILEQIKKKMKQEL